MKTGEHAQKEGVCSTASMHVSLMNVRTLSRHLCFNWCKGNQSKGVITYERNDNFGFSLAAKGKI